jgi:hypothetical protein
MTFRPDLRAIRTGPPMKMQALPSQRLGLGHRDIDIAIKTGLNGF